MNTNKKISLILSLGATSLMIIFQNCSATRFQGISPSEDIALKKNIFVTPGNNTDDTDGTNNGEYNVGDVLGAGGEIPSEGLRVSHISQAAKSFVKTCNKSMYEIEKKEVLEEVARNPKLIPVQYSISFGSKTDDLAFVAHSRAILTDNRGIFKNQYIVPYSTLAANDTKSLPGYYVRGYYTTDYSKAKSDYIFGKRCFFNTVQITSDVAMPQGGYMPFLKNKPEISNLHGSHYLISGQEIPLDQTQFTLKNKVNNLREPQIIALFVADIRSKNFTPKYQDKILKSINANRGKTMMLNTNDIFDLEQVFTGFNDHVLSLAQNFKGETGKTFSSLTGAPQLLFNILSGVQDTTVLVPSQYTPIVLDLGEIGIKTSDATWGTYFDMAATGKGAHKTSWLGGDLENQMGKSRQPASVNNSSVKMDVQRTTQDGFLVLPSQEGRVSSSKNLFGDNLEVHGKTYENGFLALQALANKKCDSTDIKERYLGPWDSKLYTSTIKVWVDGNRNGIDETGELFSLKDVGVVALNVCHYISEKETDSFGNGTAMRSAFLRADPEDITNLLADEDEIISQLQDGLDKNGKQVEFRLAVDLIFNTFPELKLHEVSSLSMASK
ncbi:MAG: hypothetical protein A2622_11680 [Bdellovibrionales bacterium RIFCSPHIGHO2_01_FULL_40_29]|nr:MAG: hypothetical protein A2622_11680 [Bdellovibrionales bacterium RIFCSPHIGHO2_01_FULL_40_29]OFZ35267.1 MAG: hypothetical protein A3D17_08675 [Bdellovibrionales bacterium RIFCSPHIGHO2_02_FULL_40_15]